MLGRLSTTLATLALALAAPAAAQAPPEVLGPYDGSIPFNCELQNVGTGTDFPDPQADPFCVEFDKTSQNVTELGLAEFLAREPARVAAASTKCFYFQRDHWTGSIVQGEPPELWHWDGDYWFDRARGVGGVSVRNLRVGGQPFDATPLAPAAFAPYLDPDGGGGVMVELETNPDPICGARVDTPQERDEVYAGRPIGPGCIAPGGQPRGKRLGRVRLGLGRDHARSRLGPPAYARPRFDAWCLVGRGELRVGYVGRRAAMLVTSGRGHSIRGIARGDRRPRAAARLALPAAPELKAGGVRAFRARRPGKARIWVGVARNRVRWLALAQPGERLAKRPLRALLRRLP